MEMINLESLLCLSYTRGAFSSGFSWDRILPIIETDVRIHNPRTPRVDREWIHDSCWLGGFTIHAGWVTCYSSRGVFKWHRDKGYGGGTHRIIFTVDGGCLREDNAF